MKPYAKALLFGIFYMGLATPESGNAAPLPDSCAHYAGVELSGDDKAVLAAMAPVVEGKKEELGVAIYKELFEKHPEVKGMFKNPDTPGPVVQFFIDFAKDPDSVAAKYAEVSAQHTEAGVVPDHYPVLEGIFLAKATEAFGLDADQGAVWKRAYAVMARIFIGNE